MQVVIFCGGLGARLGEETEFKPKPMVEIGGKPILWHILKTFAHHQFTDFILAIGYKGVVIKEYFVNYKLFESDFTIDVGSPESIRFHELPKDVNWNVTLVDTGLKTTKAGRLRRLDKYIKGETFMVTYGDGVSDVNITELCAFHENHGKIATVTGISPTSIFGEMMTKGNEVVGFREKPVDNQKSTNGGYFVFNRRVMDYLADDDGIDLETHTLVKLAHDGELMVYRHKGFWACMDTLRDKKSLCELWDSGNAPWKVWTD